jgi:tRNA1Val (adenine37-N6)-methyltransferase
MGNSWFQFRQFRVEQGRSAMKVCSDSCLFGALVSKEVSSQPVPPGRILDLGCGTGLLGLMLAQALPKAEIIGLELHPGSAEDSRLNFQQSPWGNRLILMEGDFRDLDLSRSKFDCIICNPPYFLSHLRSPDPARNAAMHNSETGLKEWVDFLSSCLHPEGRIWMLMHENTLEKLPECISNGPLNITRCIHLVRNPEIRWRVVVCLENKKSNPVKMENWLIMNEKGMFLQSAKEILSPYYDA